MRVKGMIDPHFAVVLMILLRAELTAKEIKTMLFHYCCGKTFSDIAKDEGCRPQNIQERHRVSIIKLKSKISIFKNEYL